MDIILRNSKFVYLLSLMPKILEQYLLVEIFSSVWDCLSWSWCGIIYLGRKLQGVIRQEKRGLSWDLLLSQVKQLAWQSSPWGQVIKGCFSLLPQRRMKCESKVTASP